MRTLLIITCEHGGNRLPDRWAPLFRGRAAWLRSHRGYDIGAAAVALRLARRLDAPLFVARTSRLLVDLNRSLHHPRLFSEVTRPLPKEERQRIVERHYEPHRSAVEHAIFRATKRGAKVLHVGVHSFTPVWDGAPRRTIPGVVPSGICAAAG